MIIVPNKERLLKVALIDPKLAYGQPGQYVGREGTTADMLKFASEGDVDGKEVRYYYKNLATSAGEPVPSQLIITHIPPGHVQPFHTHYKLHEFTIVTEGSIVVVDHDTLVEHDVDGIKKFGMILRVGDVVIEDPGVRHTIMNPNSCRAVIYTVQTARIPLAEFPHDWVRDQKPAEAEQKAA